jgi:hypothetical protein
MRVLTTEQIKVLEENEWVIVCESPFEMEYCSQFQGSVTCKSTEEAISIYKGIIKHNKTMKTFKEYQEKEKAKEFEKDIKEFKSKVKDLLVAGITEDTLLEFYMVSCWYGKKHGSVVTSTTLKKYFKEVFDEVDPT